MLPNEPIDILAIASQRVYDTGLAVSAGQIMQHSERSALYVDNAVTQYAIALDDMDAVQALIRELSR